MITHLAVSRAPQWRTSGCEAPPQAARSALDAEHGGHDGLRAKGPDDLVFAIHPPVPSPDGRRACRAQGSRVPVINAGTIAHDLFSTPTAQSLLPPRAKRPSRRRGEDPARISGTYAARIYGIDKCSLNIINEHLHGRAVMLIEGPMADGQS